MPGFPSYLWLPEYSSILNHVPGLSTNRASRYFERLPSRPAESGSLALCAVLLLWLPSDPAVGQRRPCQSNCLPCGQGGVRFFRSGATRVVNRPGSPATLGERKKVQRCSGPSYWSPGPDSNRQPFAYKASALPIELLRQTRGPAWRCRREILSGASRRASSRSCA